MNVRPEQVDLLDLMYYYQHVGHDRSWLELLHGSWVAKSSLQGFLPTCNPALPLGPAHLSSPSLSHRTKLLGSFFVVKSSDYSQLSFDTITLSICAAEASMTQSLLKCLVSSTMLPPLPPFLDF